MQVGDVVQGVVAVRLERLYSHHLASMERAELARVRERRQELLLAVQAMALEEQGQAHMALQDRGL